MLQSQTRIYWHSRKYNQRASLLDRTEEPNQSTKCSLKRIWMIGYSLEYLQILCIGTPGFKVSSVKFNSCSFFKKKCLCKSRDNLRNLLFSGWVLTMTCWPTGSGHAQKGLKWGACPSRRTGWAICGGISDGLAVVSSWLSGAFPLRVTNVKSVIQDRYTECVGRYL
jgi:hypothetical protein